MFALFIHAAVFPILVNGSALISPGSGGGQQQCILDLSSLLLRLLTAARQKTFRSLRCFMHVWVCHITNIATITLHNNYILLIGYLVCLFILNNLHCMRNRQ